MTQETVAVITTVLNEREGIRDLLDGFLKQTRPPDEIIVVDGGSIDGTIDMLEQLRSQHPSIRVFVEEGVNIARGRNIAILRARSSIIAVTDGGCRPEPDWLQALIQPLLTDPGFGAVTGTRRIVAANRFELYAGILSTSGNAPVEKDRVFHGRNSAFRKSVWLAAGGYPEWLYTAEDTLFAQRAKALGCRVAVAPDAVVDWRPRPNLRKLAKQYFLYGRGTGRIGAADVKAARYHLRNHAIWVLSLLLSVVFPWSLLIAVAMLLFLYTTLLRPAIAPVKVAHPSLWTDLYVSVIVMVRSVANNWGQLYGLWEFRRADGFRRNLELYRSGRWKMADLEPAHEEPTTA